ncbi:MAG: GDYXXLXY domain-containing protein [Piscinibacter sp.]
MSARPLPEVLRAAQAEGLLPASATLPDDESRPWPVVLLTALGAWLATLPLLGVIGLLLGDLIERSIGPYLVGALLLAGALVVLRSRALPLFVEQLALPALLTGGGALGFGLFRDLGTAAGAVLLALVALGVAAAQRAAWLRVLLGAAAAVLLAVALTPGRWFFESRSGLAGWWWSWHIVLGAWLVAVLAPRPRGRAAAVESLAAGWLLATLAGLAWWSGMSFLVGGAMGGGLVGEVAQELGRTGGRAGAWPVQQGLSAVLALAAAAWALRRWPPLRHPAPIGAALVLMGLAAFMPSLGAVLLALAVCVTSRRWRLATAAAVAAAWIVGAFYYQLAWPLTTKALVLAAAGALLAALAAWAARLGTAQTAASGGASPSPSPRASWGLLASLLAVLAVANGAIWQKEALIRDGRPLFVELAPVDPRSLMQGDYMQLNFNLPGEPAERRAGLLRAQRPQLVVHVDQRGVATPRRVDDGTPLADGELRIELSPKDGRWTLVTDAWFFAEGEAERWSRAKYGEFRVDAQGRALLVGLRGAMLEAL